MRRQRAGIGRKGGCAGFEPAHRFGDLAGVCQRDGRIHHRNELIFDELVGNCRVEPRNVFGRRCRFAELPGVELRLRETERQRHQRLVVGLAGARDRARLLQVGDGRGIVLHPRLRITADIVALQALRVQRDGAVGGRERVGELLLLQRGIGIFLIRLQRQRFVLIRHGAGFVERRSSRRRVADERVGDAEQRIGLRVAGMRVEVRLQVGFRLIVFAAANIGERRRQRTSADCRSIATERQLEIVKRRDRFRVARRRLILR